MMDAPDARLLEAVAGGDEIALATLVGRYHRQVRAACARQCPQADVDDSVQAVFLVLHRRASAAAKAPVLLAWLLKVARYVSLRAGQADRRRRQAEAGSAAPASRGAGPDAAVLEHLDAALLGLNERQRAAVILHVVEGEAPASVAERLGVSSDNAYKLIQRGLEGLRTALQRRGVPIGATALAACLARAGDAAEAVPADLVQLITHAPGVRAKLLATKAISAMTISSLVPAASILLAGSLVGIGLLAVEPAPRPVPKAEVPPVVAPAPVVPADPLLTQPVTAVLRGDNLLEVTRSLNCLLRQRLDVVMPQHQIPGKAYVDLDGPVKVPRICLVLPPGATVATALDGIAQQAGCTWRLVAGLICFEDRIPRLEPLATTWDVLDVHRALTQGDAATVGRGIAAWLDLPQRRPVLSLLAHPRTWLGRVALLSDARLAERFWQACPDFPGKRTCYDDAMLGDPHPRDQIDGPAELTDLTRLIDLADPGDPDPSGEEAGIAAVDMMLTLPEVGSLVAFEARTIRALPYMGDILPQNMFTGKHPRDGFRSVVVESADQALANLLTIRGDGALRCRMLDSGLMKYVGNELTGSGCDPTWRHRLAEALRADDADPLRLRAEKIVASSADPACWTLLLETWRNSLGQARQRLTGLVLGAGQRGCDAILTALADGSLPVEVLIASLADQRLSVPEIGLCAAVAGNPAWPDSLRQAAILALCKVPAHPEVERTAADLMAEGRRRSNTLLTGLGLRLRHGQGRIGDNDPDLERALRSPSPYLRAVALTIEFRRLVQAQSGSQVLTMRELLRRSPAVLPPASKWPARFGRAKFLPPDPVRAAIMLTMARSDPNSQVRFRAAALGLHLLPESERPGALQALSVQEQDPALRKRLDDRIPHQTFAKNGDRIAMTWETPEILSYGECDMGDGIMGPKFPEWRDSRDGTDVVPLDGADQDRSWKGFKSESVEVALPSSRTY